MNEERLSHVAIVLILGLVLWVGYAELQQSYTLARINERTLMQNERLDRVITFVITLDEDIRATLLTGDEEN